MGAWIETIYHYVYKHLPSVAPYVGAWIETTNGFNPFEGEVVAPYVGAWIETNRSCLLCIALMVAPYVGAWIETYYPVKLPFLTKSHPTWVRGLKRLVPLPSPLWIRRTLRGCVD